MRPSQFLLEMVLEEEEEARTGFFIRLVVEFGFRSRLGGRGKRRQTKGSKR